VGKCGKVWESVGKCGKVWESVGKCGKVWERRKAWHRLDGVQDADKGYLT
jgi:hypothetical protein